MEERIEIMISDYLSSFNSYNAVPTSPTLLISLAPTLVAHSSAALLTVRKRLGLTLGTQIGRKASLERD